ncbi:WYL domain-containing protein [Lederbergia lenta]|uniref:WYL domain-containing protein n=1 Tax=Lederbergia lenta TaxID=1467 RepID=A0A2X4W5Z3_LEDLE|nr:hypothetical protein [Lederbergia lenta]MCM3109834.1 hypothetical protein [Lederbergia lenta]MEC2324392.1 hypothetical protein [Lederbergia lenta]SQI60057.1 Uncharacterised protein [Lederbergia lenta]
MDGLLRRAVGTQDKIEMIYLSNDGTVSQRTIKVLKVTNESIKAYCYYRKKFRTFKLTNILSVGPLRQKRGA